MKTSILLGLILGLEAKAQEPEMVVPYATVLECRAGDFFREIRSDGNPVLLEIYGSSGSLIDSFNPQGRLDEKREAELKRFGKCYKQSDLHLEGCLVGRNLYVLQAQEKPLDLKMIVFDLGTKDFTNTIDSFSLNPDSNQVIGKRMIHHMRYITYCDQ